MSKLSLPGERLRTLRKSLDLSGQALANALGVTKTAVSYWESGRTELPKVTCLAISQLFGVSADWLFRGEGPQWLDRGATSPLVPVQPWEGAPTEGGALPVLGLEPHLVSRLIAESGGGMPEDLRGLQVCDPLMAELLGTDAILVINTSLEARRLVQDHALYVLGGGNQHVRIRRLARIPGSQDLLAGTATMNQVPERLEMPEGGVPSLVLGRVCWMGKSLI